MIRFVLTVCVISFANIASAQEATTTTFHECLDEHHADLGTGLAHFTAEDGSKHDIEWSVNYAGGLRLCVSPAVLEQAYLKHSKYHQSPIVEKSGDRFQILFIFATGTTTIYRIKVFNGSINPHFAAIKAMRAMGMTISRNLGSGRSNLKPDCP